MPAVAREFTWPVSLYPMVYEDERDGGFFTRGGLPLCHRSTGHGSFSLAADVDVGAGDPIPASAAGPIGYDPFPLPVAGGEEAGVRIDASTSHARSTPGGDPAADRQVVQSHAFRPAEPGLLERTLNTVSGWHALIAPFLVQNIGWFISYA